MGGKRPHPTVSMYVCMYVCLLFGGIHLGYISLLKVGTGIKKQAFLNSNRG